MSFGFFSTSGARCTVKNSPLLFAQITAKFSPIRVSKSSHVSHIALLYAKAHSGIFFYNRKPWELAIEATQSRIDLLFEMRQVEINRRSDLTVAPYLMGGFYSPMETVC